MTLTSSDATNMSLASPFNGLVEHKIMLWTRLQPQQPCCRSLRLPMVWNSRSFNMRMIRTAGKKHCAHEEEVAVKYKNRRLARSSPAVNQASLEPPSIIYQDRQLLLVNKPPGWHSVPNKVNHNNSSSDGEWKSSKCLISHLKRQKLGGGLDQQFLLPLHRIDQPCSGILLLAKNKRVASRISQMWKQQRHPHEENKQDDEQIEREHHELVRGNTEDDFIGMRKTYFCVVWSDDIPRLIDQSTLLTSMNDTHQNSDHNSNGHNNNNSLWYQLQGLWHKHAKHNPHRRRMRLTNQNHQDIKDHRHHHHMQDEEPLLKGWSVFMTSVDRIHSNDSRIQSSSARLCQLSWRIIPIDTKTARPRRRENALSSSGANQSSTPTSPFTLLEIQTHQGARHMIRAMLAQIGNCPIIGDQRYSGNKFDDDDDDDDDLSVESSNPRIISGWDRSVALHARSLEWFHHQNHPASTKANNKIKQSRRFFFSAPIPTSWYKYFGICNDHLS